MNGTQNDTKVASTPSSAEKPRKKWLAPLIIFGSIAVIAVAAATFFFIWEQGKVSAPVCKGTIAEPEKLTSSQKISKDYEERLQQLYNHELFHEYQDIYARELGADYSTAPMVYSDATANMASALAAEYNTTSSFLNDWASQYFANDNTNLQSITDSVSYGYGAFPYFYAYSQEVEGWAEPLMYAHTKENPYQYLHDATEHEDMLKIADRLSDYLLTNDFDNNALVSYSTVRTEDVLFKHTFDEGTVQPGLT